MKDSIKANLIIFLIISITAFALSSAFIDFSVINDNNQTKLTAIENDSFIPHEIKEVPTYVPPVVKNVTYNNTTTIGNFTDYNITKNITPANNTK